MSEHKKTGVASAGCQSQRTQMETFPPESLAVKGKRKSDSDVNHNEIRERGNSKSPTEQRKIVKMKAELFHREPASTDDTKTTKLCRSRTAPRQIETRRASSVPRNCAERSDLVLSANKKIQTEVMSVNKEQKQQFSQRTSIPRCSPRQEKSVSEEPGNHHARVSYWQKRLDQESCQHQICNCNLYHERGTARKSQHTYSAERKQIEKPRNSCPKHHSACSEMLCSARSTKQRERADANSVPTSTKADTRRGSTSTANEKPVSTAARTSTLNGRASSPELKSVRGPPRSQEKHGAEQHECVQIARPQCACHKYKLHFLEQSDTRHMTVRCKRTTADHPIEADPLHKKGSETRPRDVSPVRYQNYLKPKLGIITHKGKPDVLMIVQHCKKGVCSTKDLKHSSEPPSAQKTVEKGSRKVGTQDAKPSDLHIQECPEVSSGREAKPSSPPLTGNDEAEKGETENHQSNQEQPTVEYRDSSQHVTTTLEDSVEVTQNDQYMADKDRLSGTIEAVSKCAPAESTTPESMSEDSEDTNTDTNAPLSSTPAMLAPSSTVTEDTAVEFVAERHQRTEEIKQAEDVDTKNEKPSDDKVVTAINSSPSSAADITLAPSEIKAEDSAVEFVAVKDRSVGEIKQAEEIGTENGKSSDHKLVTSTDSPLPFTVNTLPPTSTVDDTAVEFVSERDRSAEEIQHDEETDTGRSSDLNICENPKDTKSVASAKMADCVLQSSAALNNLHCMLIDWKNNLLAMHAALDTLSTDGADETCSEQDSQNKRLIGDIRRVILKFRHSRVTPRCYTCHDKTGAPSEYDGHEEEEQSARDLSMCHCLACQWLAAVPVQQSLGILLDDVDLLMDTLDIFKRMSSERNWSAPGSSQNDVAKINEGGANTTLNRLQDVPKTGSPVPRVGSCDESSPGHNLPESETQQTKGTSVMSVADRVRSEDLCANHQYRNVKACSETAIILESKQIHEELKQEHSCENDYSSDSCLTNCYMVHRNFPALNRNATHTQISSGKHVGQKLSSFSSASDSVKCQEEAFESAGHRDMHPKEDENKPEGHVDQANKPLSPTFPDLEEREPVLPTAVGNSQQMKERQRKSSSKQQSTRQTRALGKFLLRYLKHIESRLQVMGYEEECFDKSKYYEDYCKYLSNTSVTGNISKHATTIPDISPQVSVLDQVSEGINTNLERFITSENNIGRSVSNNSSYELMYSFKGIIDSLSKIRCDDTYNCVPEQNIIQKESVHQKQLHSGYSLHTDSQVTRKLVTETEKRQENSGSSVNGNDQSKTAPSSDSNALEPSSSTFATQLVTRPNTSSVPSAPSEVGSNIPRSCQIPGHRSPEATDTDDTASRNSQKSWSQMSKSQTDSGLSSSRDLSSPQAELYTSSCVSVSVTGSEEVVGVQEAFNTIDQTLQQLAYLMKVSERGKQQQQQEESAYF